MNFRQSCWL